MTHNAEFALTGYDAAREPGPASNPASNPGTPANDTQPGLIARDTRDIAPDTGLFDGKAPNPGTEFPGKAEPDFSALMGDHEPGEGGDSPGEAPGTVLKFPGGSLVSGKPAEPRYMPESEFVDFWAKGIWDIISILAGFFGADLSELQTKEEDLEQGREAAKRLYKLAMENPKYLGWMVSEATLEGGDWLICLAFFGAKAKVVWSKCAAFKKSRAEARAKARAATVTQGERVLHPVGDVAGTEPANDA